MAVGAWGVAWVGQAAAVWDYAGESSERVGMLMKASPAVGEGQRVATLCVEPRGRFRANPLLHADCLMGVGTGNIIWSNYETRFYYFPVQVRPEVEGPDAGEFEKVAVMGAPEEKEERAERWARLMDRHHRQFDRLVVWGRDAALEGIAGRWFEPGPRFEEGAVRVLGRRVGSLGVEADGLGGTGTGTLTRPSGTLSRGERGSRP